MFDQIKRFFAPPVFEDEEQARIASLLRLILLALLVALILTAFISLFFGYFQAVSALTVGVAGMLGALWLTRRGHLRVASSAVLLMFLGVLNYLLYTGDGIHDIAAVAYPVVIVIAGLLLDKRTFIAYTLLTILSLQGVIYGELNGFIVNTSTRSTLYADSVSVSVILFITAVSAHLLADNIARSIARVRSSRRALAEGNRELIRVNDELAREITDRKRAEEVLQQEREIFASILQKAPCGVLLIDTDERCLYINPEFTHITGHTLDEVPTVADWFRHAFPDPVYRQEITERWRADTVQRIGRVFSVACKGGKAREVEFKSTISGDGRAIMVLADITERKRAEEALRRSLEEIARNQRLLLALSRAAQAVQRARTPEEVYQTIGGEIVKLGHHATILTVTDDQAHLTVSHMTFESALLRAAEKLTGLSARGYCFPLKPGGFYERLIAEGKTVFSDPDAGPIAEALPGPVRPLAGQLGAALGVEKVIYAPLKVGGETRSLLMVMGADLTEANVPAVSAFASQAVIAVENAQLYQAAQQEIAERKRAEAALQEQARALRESEERARERQLYLERVLAAAPDAIIALTSRHRIVEWNLGAERLFGYSREEVIGQDPDHLITGRDVFAEVASFTQMVLSGQDVGPVETIRYHKDGSPVHVIAAGSPIMAGDELIGTVAIYTDITTRKQAEQERERLLEHIREQARQVKQIVDTVPAGVLLLGPDLRVLVANPKAEEYLGVLADAKVEDALAALSDRPVAELLTSPPEGLWHEVEVKGPPRWLFEVIARPMESGFVTEGWVLVIRDVTQERAVEQRVQQQERLAAVGQLAAGIAHDFNNIMATIIMYAQMSARAQELPAPIRGRLETIDQQARHATQLIQQILDFSRRTALERRPMDLLVFLKEQVKMLKRTLPESIEIELAYDEGDYTVSADLTRMQQVLMNLAINARDAMPEGGILRIGLERVRVRSRREAPLPEMEPGVWVRVAVSDTGTGIPSEVLPHIFDPFFTTKPDGGGTGLGLAQVWGIVKRHEGHIDVTTQEGTDRGQSGGTTFTIYLPVLPAPQPTALPQEELSTLPQGRGETILVVEDNATVRQAVVEGLESLNYRPLAAANGREALAVFERHAEGPSTPDVPSASGQGIALVVSDTVMPEMGGVALLHALRGKGYQGQTVMLTGHPVHDMDDDLRLQGVVEWLQKPVSLEQLAQVLARALEE